MNSSEQVRQRELQGYLAEKVAAAADEIAPQLFSFIGGDSEEAIDASVEMIKRKSAELVRRARQMQARPDDVDPQWQQANREAFGDRQPLTEAALAERVSRMSLSEYASFRQQAGIGMGRNISLDGFVRAGE